MVKFMQGAVKWFDDSKKFGFLYVLDEDGQRSGDEVFFHYSLAGKPGADYSGDRITIYGGHRGNRVALPRRGDLVTFLDEGRGDATASTWVYTKDFDAAIAAFMDEPVQYRIVLKSVRHMQVPPEIIVFMPGDSVIREGGSSRADLMGSTPSVFGLTSEHMRSDLHLARTSAHVEIFSMHGGLMRWHTIRRIESSDVMAELV